jgi:hypothetical protein
MAKTSFVPAVAAFALLLAAAPSSAHHTYPVDRSELVTVSGTVRSP